MQITFPDSYVSNCEWGEAQLRGKVRITWARSLNSIIVGNLAEKSSSSSLHGERLNLHVCIPHTCGLEHNLQRLLSGYRRDFTTVTPANCARDPIRVDQEQMSMFWISTLFVFHGMKVQTRVKCTPHNSRFIYSQKNVKVKRHLKQCEIQSKCVWGMKGTVGNKSFVLLSFWAHFVLKACVKYLEK